MVGRELHLVTAVGQGQFLDGHHPGVVDEDVERPVPSGDEGGGAGRVGQFQRDPALASARAISTPMPEAPPVTMA
jgi:hypothetical protein